ncbi:MAG: CRISPR-associated protein Csx20 [Spirochaetes bacterium]|nr:CRISPR-associated protein Csx20 [Spirochaetota bacterium]
MPALYFVFNHSILPSQKEDAKKTLHVDQIYELPQELKELWAQIPPEIDDITPHLAPIVEWLERKTSPGDYVLVQGDFGATYYVVRWAAKHGRIPVYSTSQRIYESKIDENGTVVNVHRFAHVRFRTYRGVGSCEE